MMNKRKQGKSGAFLRTLIVSLIICLMSFSVASFAALDFVYADTYGTVDADGDGLNVRSGPGTSYGKIGWLADGSSVTILLTTNGWHKINYGTGTGYVSADYVKTNSGSNTGNNGNTSSGGNSSGGSSAASDAAFESSIAGFPDSYKPYLRTLHSKYPNWIFVPQNTNLNWEDVIKKEAYPKNDNSPFINLVPASWSTPFKSTASAAFNSSGAYIVFDSGNFVAASEAAVRYYMDPRNFINENSVFQFLSIVYNEKYQSLAGINNITAGSFLSKTFPEKTYASYAALLMAAGKQSGANPLVLASMIIQEQGYNGNSGLISGKVSGYEGYYNHFNIGAYAHSGRSAVTNGLIYAKKNGWNSITKSIINGATYYAKNFIYKGQNTLYLKKFNVMNGLNAVGTNQYMTAVYGANSEGVTLRSGFKNALSSGLEFEIPVYKNMPAKASPVPTASSSGSSSGGSSSGGSSSGSGSGGSSSGSGSGSSSSGSTSTTTINEIRVAGATEYNTSEQAANRLKQVLGVTKFQNIILATGANYLDALSSTYIAAMKNAPVLLTDKNDISGAVNYVKNNLATGGKVYIIGGKSALPTTLENALSGIATQRIAGPFAYDTNMAVLRECKVNNQEILVCSDSQFHDALSASATGKPILLVSDKLEERQKAYLSSIKVKKFIIIGGTSAVSTSVQDELSAYAPTSRVAGAKAYDTSLKVATTFFPGTHKNMVIATSKLYFDGVSAGPLAYKLNAPIILVLDKFTYAAKSYLNSNNVKNLYVMGGTSAIYPSMIKEITS